MFCKQCGYELPDSAKYCPSCGAQVSAGVIAASSARDSEENTAVASSTPTNVVATAEGKKKQAHLKMSPILLLVLAMALFASTAFASYSIYTHVYTPSRNAQLATSSTSATSTTNSEETSADSTSEESASRSANEAPAPTEEEIVFDRIAGWWVTVGNSQSVFYRFRGSTFERYAYDFVNNTGYSYTGAGTVASVEPLTNFPDASQDTAGYSINIESTNRFRYYLRDAQPDFLECHWDYDGYSGSDSLGRLEEVPPELAALGDQIEQEAATATADEASQEDASAATDAASTANTADYHVASNRYEFDIPEYWRGKVDVVQDGDQTSVCSAGTSLRLMRLEIESPEAEQAGGDISAANVWSQQLSDGNFVVLRVTTGGMFTGMDYLGERYSAEEVNTYADLMSSGTRTAEQLANQDYGEMAGGPLALQEIIDSIVVKG